MPDRGPGTQKSAANSDINWVTTFFMAAFHVGAMVALFFFTWKALFVAMFSGGYPEAWASEWGITGCSHIAATELPSGSSIF
jgi:hypothetical protein